MRQSIEDLYPLSPMQEGLLFQSLLNPEARPYVTQHSSVVEQLDVPCFRQAWQHVIDRHPVLRTAFVWKAAARPLQAVVTPVEVPFEERDWRALSAEAQQRSIAEYLREDQRQGFDLHRAPLLRIAVVRLTECTHRVFVTHHHALLDGWSLPLLFGELSTVYGALCKGEPVVLPPVRPFREYIVWLQRADVAQGAEYWRHRLAGVHHATPVGIVPAPQAPLLLTMGEVARRVPVATSRRVRACAQRQGLTLHTLTSAAWALALGRVARTDDVVFGTVVAGRPPELDGVESMLGIFINTLPCRVRLPSSEPVASWLAALQADLVDMRQFQHTSLADVQRWAGVPAGQPLFTTIIDALNYPAPRGEACEAAFHPREGIYSNPNTFPVQLVTQELGSLTCRVVYDTRRIDGRAAARLLRLTEWALIALVRHPTDALGRVMRLVDAASRVWERTARGRVPPAVPARPGAVHARPGCRQSLRTREVAP